MSTHSLPRLLSPESLENIAHELNVLIGELEDWLSEHRHAFFVYKELVALATGIYISVDKCRHTVNHRLSIHRAPIDLNNADKIASETLYAYVNICTTRASMSLGYSEYTAIWSLQNSMDNLADTISTARQSVGINSLSIERMFTDFEAFLAKLISTFIKKFSVESVIEPTESTPLGILTVLEHEYQSVVRRMSEIHALSDKNSYGAAILDRDAPETDLRKVARRLYSSDTYYASLTGWAIGKIGNRTVVVLCTGFAGKERARESIEFFKAHFPMQGGSFFSSPSKWVVLGVCAASSREFGIGEVLVSNELLIGMERDHKKWWVARCMPPQMIDADVVARNLLDAEKELFRLPPTTKDVSIRINQDVKLQFMKFICSNRVINSDEELVDALAAARSASHNESPALRDDEHVGIEMEGIGSPNTALVVKGVCDYADNDKANWKDDFKNILQLYSAEMAAEMLVIMVDQL